jgi:hypothetical protein
VTTGDSAHFQKSKPMQAAMPARIGERTDALGIAAITAIQSMSKPGQRTTHRVWSPSVTTADSAHVQKSKPMQAAMPARIGERTDALGIAAITTIQSMSKPGQRTTHRVSSPSVTTGDSAHFQKFKAMQAAVPARIGERADAVGTATITTMQSISKPWQRTIHRFWSASVTTGHSAHYQESKAMRVALPARIGERADAFSTAAITAMQGMLKRC